MKYAEHIADLVGNTPLVKLNSVTEGRRRDGPGEGRVHEPGRVREGPHRAARWSRPPRPRASSSPAAPSSSPPPATPASAWPWWPSARATSASSCAPTRSSQDKRDVLKAYGAEVVVCPTAVAPDHPDSYYRVSDRLVREIEGAWKPNQYANPKGPASHYETHRARRSGTTPTAGSPTSSPASAPAAPSPAPAATCARSPPTARAAACRSSAPTPRARSTPAAPAAPTSSRASARTSGRPPTTRRWSTRSSPSATPTRSR